MWPKFSQYSPSKSNEASQGLQDTLVLDAPYPAPDHTRDESVVASFVRRVVVIWRTVSYFIFIASLVIFLLNIVPILFKALLSAKNSEKFLDEQVPGSFAQQFTEFAEKYNRNYPSEEERQYRFSVFVRNVVEMEEDEKRLGGGLDLDITEFADWTEMEMRRLLSRGYTDRIPFEGTKFEGKILNEGETRPASVDWRKHNKVTAVKNQQQCGSCWSFAVVASIESALAIKNNSLVTLSEQELVDCESDNNGCHGGYRPYAYRYVKSHGLVEEKLYPYTGQESGQCKLKEDQKRFYIHDYEMLSTNEETVANWVYKRGPVTFGMNVTKPMYSYRSGVFNPSAHDCHHKSLGSHALTIVGYGKHDNQDYWLVKNSWGASWGDSGYFKLARGVNSCGAANTVVAPIIN